MCVYIPLKQGTLKKQGSSDCSVKSDANGKNQVLHLPSTENEAHTFLSQIRWIIPASDHAKCAAMSHLCSVLWTMRFIREVTCLDTLQAFPIRSSSSCTPQVIGFKQYGASSASQERHRKMWSNIWIFELLVQVCSGLFNPCGHNNVHPI